MPSRTPNAAVFALPIAAAALCGAVSAAPAPALTGDYVEARSASVYAGACHYNGELTTAGREAVLMIRVKDGAYRGVPLAGQSVLAAVAGSENLAESGTGRRSVLYVPDAASAAQRDALVALMKAKAGATLGEVVAVKPLPLTVTLDAQKITVRALRADGAPAVSLDVTRYPCKHCLMPAQTWYEPFVKVPDAAVAQGVSTGFSEKVLGVTWRQETADNAFVGTLSL